MSDYPYEVAVSFSGSDRARVLSIVEEMGRALGKDRIYYDKEHEHQLHRPRMDEMLIDIYVRQSRLVIVFVSAQYIQRQWCQTEWKAIRTLRETMPGAVNQPSHLRVAILRLDATPLPGLNPNDGFLDISSLSTARCVEYLLKRHKSIVEAGYVEEIPGPADRSRPGVLDRLKGLLGGRGAHKAEAEPAGVLTPAQLDPTRIPFTNALHMEFVPLPPGKFEMGDLSMTPGSLEERRHLVTLRRGFFIATTPVTQAQWRSVMRDRPSPSEHAGDNRPVERVSWHDCQEFCRRLSAGDPARRTYRLPTEAEWEYACRAGTRTPYFWGEKPAGAKAYANLFDRSAARAHVRRGEPAPWDDGFPTTSPVKSFKPNGFGLYDMIGNVWEWCQDWYGPHPSIALFDPEGPQQGQERVLRGASWHDGPEKARSFSRAGMAPGRSDGHIGFRVVHVP